MKLAKGLHKGEDDRARCWWCEGQADYREYHDAEWGRPCANDHQLFEKICLEGFQSGLSWLTILRKRENFRRAFSQFDFAKVARFNESKVERLLQDTGIVRHRGKIESTINNAKRAKEMQREFGSLAAYFWQFEPPASERPRTITHRTVSKLGSTETSTRLSKDLKRRGWSFVGPTTAYAFMQSMGMVNDHLVGCHVREECEKARSRFKRPVPK
jgi:DNA-3-methyladenine glycosylase I